jgi:hypothetical protein
LGGRCASIPTGISPVVISRGDRRFAVHGLDEGELRTLEDVRQAGDALSFDEKRLAMELTPHEKRRMWGVSDLEY